MTMTRVVRMGLRFVQVAALTALGGSIAAPAVADALPKHPVPRVLTHPLTRYSIARQEGMSPASQVVLAEPVLDDLQLAKQTAHTKPTTAAIPKVKAKSVAEKPKPPVGGSSASDAKDTGQVKKPEAAPAPVEHAAPARAMRDDYPWAHGATRGMSPLRYDLRDCTDFVAWRINRDAGVTSAPWKWTWGNLRVLNGNAIGWKTDWVLRGWKVNIRPVPGAIAWFGYNHVAYVAKVDGNMVTLEEYNWGGSQSYHTRTVPVSAVDSFLASPA